MTNRTTLETLFHSNNFCRVFEIPNEYPEGFLFGGGKPVHFQMVDWFNPIPPPDMLREYNIDTWEDCEKQIIEFLLKKKYVREGYKYLVITSFDESFIFFK